MGFFGWAIIIIIAIVIIAAIVDSSNEAEQQEKIENAPPKLAAILKEEFPDFSSDITTVKCGFIVEAIVSNQKILKKTHDSNGKLKSDKKSISIIKKLCTDELAPLISNEFHQFAKSDPDLFFKSFYKALELSG